MGEDLFMNQKVQHCFKDSDFIRSSRCTFPPGGCVEVASTAAAVAIRDAKNPTQTALVFSRAEWVAFIAGVKAGEFDFF